LNSLYSNDLSIDYKPKSANYRSHAVASRKLGRRSQPMGAVRIQARRTPVPRPLGRVSVLILALAGTSAILATSASTSSVKPTKFKMALLEKVQPDAAPTPIFRFDDADSVASEDLQAAALHTAKPINQVFTPHAVASLWQVPDTQSDVKQLIVPEDKPATTETIIERFEKPVAEKKADGSAEKVTLLADQQTVNPEKSLPQAPEASPKGLSPLATRLHAQALTLPTKKSEESTGKQTSITVKPGDTLSELLAKTQISNAHRNEILNHELVKQHFTQLRIGATLSLTFNAAGQFSSMQAKVSRDTRMHIDNVGEGPLKISAVHLPIEHERVVTSGEIDQSLYLAAEKADLKQSTIMALSNIFEWELDFARDIRKGDRFTMVYDRLYRDGKYIGDGDILAAEFLRGDRKHSAIRFTDDDGNTGYYSPDGQSKRRAFMRHPVDVVRITSHFDPKRLHPVLHKIRAHKGVDYGSPYGSPIYATADGRIAFAGAKNAYGNTVILKHGDNRSTLYAHMSKIAKTAKSGKRVKRGDVIGYVGKSGRVTGTHLHYEFRISGKHVDPLKVELPGAPPLAKKYLAKLKSSSQELFAQMRSVSSEKDSQIALNK